ncbi:DUF2187 domain-containing protein [Alteribacter populi]|uniref:DUF2187 domain-containing protein n=1 Tax=Alteribacter populi TaxID=2011011 RepID=UPI001E3220F2|nr:DUF2187 domain-containing protein [Alteribacter populi]
MAEQEKNESPITVKVDDDVKVVKGEFKGLDAKVIAVYTNSIAVELNKKLEDGSYARTVLHHSEYTE